MCRRDNSTQNNSAELNMSIINMLIIAILEQLCKLKTRKKSITNNDLILYSGTIVASLFDRSQHARNAILHKNEIYTDY